MTKVIECLMIFCVLAYKYCYLFIPIMASLIILEIAENK